MISMRIGFVKLALVLVMAVPVARADWQEPKDGVMTEKELVSYLQVAKAAADNLKVAGKATEGTQSGTALAAVYLNSDAKFKANVASHGLTEEQFTWLSNKTGEAWGGVLMEQLVAEGQKALAEQRTTNEQKITALKQKLAVYQKAQTEGRKVLTKQERENVIQAAKSEQQSAADEAKQHAEELKQAQEEAARTDAEAKAADALAKNPPADVSADDRPGFVDQKKTEAQQARDLAKEAREKAEEAKKARDESLAKAAGAEKKIADPDLPLTGDEKMEVKKENDDQVTALKNDIAEGEQGVKVLDESAQAYAKSIAEQKEKSAVPPQNVALLKKHRAEFEAIWGNPGEKK